MNQDQEIRAKALEIAVLIKGAPIVGGATKDGKIILNNYLFLAEAVEQYIRGSSKSNPAESAEN